jgi:DNA repair protein RecN (Recombination protein N)
MLQLLHIENIAVIENADIEFGSGLNVLTGETGAGKSIIIDALSVVTGGRVSRELVRTGADHASVTAVFTSDQKTDAWCAENGVELDADNELFILRRISAEGKSICRVNGTPISVAQLRELGGLLLDIHGQNDGRRLLDERVHIQYLDQFGSLTGEREMYTGLYRQYRETVKEIEALEMDEGEKARRVDSLRFQIEEIEQAGIQPGEFEEKSTRCELMKNASRLIAAVDTAFCAMYGGEHFDGVVVCISEAENAIHTASKYSDDLRQIAEKLTALRYEAEDISEDLRDFKASLDFSPEEFDALESRLEALRRLMKKYGGSEAEVLSYLAQIQSELEAIEYSSDRIERLQKELAKRKEAAQDAADRLSQHRKGAAKQLERRITAELSDLNMPKVQFKVAFEHVSHPDGMDGTGCDCVRFLMSANPGEAPGRISKIASGGELSRIMLAMKNVLADSDDVGTMVFDEIDTGVSGIAAQRVGEKLSTLAAEKQVLCVTHLPQIAALADRQYAIEKGEENGRTRTQVYCLDQHGRERELARLTGGDHITEATLLSAAEQLAAAEAYRRARK